MSPWAVVVMSVWTVRQEEILREYGHLGVEAVAERLERECGVRRGKYAIAMHASRIHVSLAMRPTCPECGAVGVRLNKANGLCPECSLRLRVEEERAFNELLEAEAAGRTDGPEYERLAREYDRIRQRNSRLCRRYGLASKRERG